MPRYSLDTGTDCALTLEEHRKVTSTLQHPLTDIPFRRYRESRALPSTIQHDDYSGVKLERD